MSLEVITARPLSAFRHGFFTRKGGASTGVYESLNCGTGSRDMGEIVARNRAIVAAALDVAPEHLVTVHQVHSSRVIRVDGPLHGAPPEADALVTATPGLAIAVLTADCQPILMGDAEAGVVAAAHAGWRGALGGVIEATIEAMEGLGADRQRIRAVIGPTISQRNYEVGPELLDAFMAEDPSFARFFANGEGDRYLFDLPGLGLHLLREAGIGHAEWIGQCTYDDPLRFFSYRRACHEREADYGRLISAIRL